MASLFHIQRADDIQERQNYDRKRKTKENLVCFNKRQSYLKNMKIYNALYNFHPPNQLIRT